MALAKITILGFNQYLKDYNDDLFKNLVLPTNIDRTTLINNILNECSDFELLYANPYYMKELIGVWSKKHQRTWQKWVDALNIEYEPLYNYDRKEEWNDSGSRNKSGSNKDIYSNSTSSKGSTSDDATTTNLISAYDSNSLVNDTQSHSTGSVTNSASGTNSGTSTLTNTEEESNTNIRTGRAYGNIGVTTSQQMLQSELDISKFNIIIQITDMFIDEFCIPVYV